MDLNLGGLHIWQDPEAQPVSHASYALQLSALEFCGSRPLRVLDLGSGCGIVAIMLALQCPLWRVEGLEIQPALHTLAQRNAALCGVEILFREGDLRTFTADPPYGLIVSNPPWLEAGSGITSPSEARNISRFELHCGLEDVMACLRRNLDPQGDALILYPRDRAGAIKLAATKSLLDIISLSPATGLNDHIICHIRHKGQ